MPTSWPLHQDNLGRYDYRALKRAPVGYPRCEGWDVQAFQKCLIRAGFPLREWGADGIAGAEFQEAVIKAQAFLGGLRIDGIAGNLTQYYLVKFLCLHPGIVYHLPPGLLLAQITHESGCLVGNFTPAYANLRRDVGVVQENMAITPTNLTKGFDAPNQIDWLARELLGGTDSSRKTGYLDFIGLPGATTPEKAWKLAVAAWNAPGWATKLARGQLLTADQLAHVQAYIDSATAGVTLWPAP